MITTTDIIKKHFSDILYNNNSVKSISIDNLGYLYIMKTKYNFLIGISYDTRDDIFGVSIDFDETKFDKYPKYLKIQLDSKEMFANQRKYVKRKLGLFHVFKKDFVKYVEANIEFYAEYFKQNHQLFSQQYSI